MTGENVTHSEVSRAQRTLDALADVGLGELLGFDAFSHVDADTVNTAIEEFVHFSEQAVAPTDRDGDRIGCAFDADTASVRTSPGSIEAYEQYVAGGWGAVAVPQDFGGAGYPKVVGVAMQEVLASANLGLSLCPALTQDAIEVLSRWGSDAQREVYLPKLLTGEWNGTMQMTEPDAGSDVGAIQTMAEPLPDGGYALHGTKVFISWGEHDLTDNIVHLVLARTPGSPAGTHGLSLFLVPKFNVDPDGTLGERNGVWCRSLEHKMGLHSSPTCVIELDGAIGELIGELHGGMHVMFTMMNPARLSIGLQGLSVGETAYAEARAYAAERRQGTVAKGEPGKGATIDSYPDVRRMLALMRSALDAMRLVVYTTAINSDRAAAHPDAEARARAEGLVALLTPIAKAWVSDLGVEIASLGIQVFGGSGYMEDGPAPQRLRDARIVPIYEGTNGIQAIDLMTRKLAKDEGHVMLGLFEEMDRTSERLRLLGGRAGALGDLFGAAVTATRATSMWLLDRSSESPTDLLAGATPYLQMVGDLLGGWMLAKRALSRTEPGSAGEALDVAYFYAAERLATVPGRAVTITTGAGRLFI